MIKVLYNKYKSSIEDLTVLSDIERHKTIWKDILGKPISLEKMRELQYDIETYNVKELKLLGIYEDLFVKMIDNNTFEINSSEYYNINNYDNYNTIKYLSDDDFIIGDLYKFNIINTYQSVFSKGYGDKPSYNFVPPPNNYSSFTKGYDDYYKPYDSPDYAPPSSPSYAPPSSPSYAPPDSPDYAPGNYEPDSPDYAPGNYDPDSPDYAPPGMGPKTPPEPDDESMIGPKTPPEPDDESMIGPKTPPEPNDKKQKI